MLTLPRIAISLAVLTVCVTGAAQTAPPVKEAGSITGRITVCGKGVANVVINLTSINRAMAAPSKVTTDQDGHYAFTGIAPGQCMVIASAPGYVLASGENVALSGKPITVDEGETVENMDFPLVRGGVITGRITDTRGKPLIGERIYLLNADGQFLAGLWGAATEESLSTDDRGIYRAFGLPAGRYLVAVGGGDETGRNVSYSVRAPYRRTYYPNAFDQSQAKTVDVTEGGEVTDIDITAARPLKNYTASGRVIDGMTGKPVVNAWIHSFVLAADGKRVVGRGPEGKVDGKGSFRLEGLLPGRYIASSTIVDSNGYADPVQFEVTDKDVSSLEFKVKSGVIVNGVAVISGADLTQANDQLGQLQLGAYMAGTELSAPRALPTISINPGGSFSVRGVSPGRLNLHLAQAAANKSFSILQVERDGVPQANGITISQGEQSVNLKVVLGHGTGTVRGQLKIENGELPPGAHVWATIFASGKTAPLQETRADVRNRFAFEGLHSGEYEVTVHAYVPSTTGSNQWAKSTSEKVFVTRGSESQLTLILNLGRDK